MEFVIGIVTYCKNGALQLLESELLDSIRSQYDFFQLKERISIVVYVNSDMTPEELNKIRVNLIDRLGRVKVEVIGGVKSQVPIARNNLLQYIAFNHKGCALFMPDDDDKFVTDYALDAMIKCVDKYGVDYPILLAFNGLDGNNKPNNRRVFPNPEHIYDECNGYFNWNAIYGIEYFVKNQFCFPEYLNPPHRSHDTIIDLKNQAITKNHKFVFLANPIIDYKYPPELNTLSSRPRPDSPLFDATEYLYEDSIMHQVETIVHYNPLTNMLDEIDITEYRSLRFRSLDQVNEIGDKLFGRNIRLVNIMGRLTMDLKVESFTNSEGFDLVTLSLNGVIRHFRLSKFLYLDEVEKTPFFQRYLKCHTEGMDLSKVIYIEVK